jgi:hypothetical protein
MKPALMITNLMPTGTAQKVSDALPRGQEIEALASALLPHCFWGNYSHHAGSPACAPVPCSTNGSRKSYCRSYPKAQSSSSITPDSTNPKPCENSQRPQVSRSCSCHRTHPKIISSSTNGSLSKTPPEKSSRLSMNYQQPSKQLSSSMTNSSLIAIA